MKFYLEHMLPRRLRYAKIYLQAGAASVFFSLNGTSANWQARIGRSGEVEMSDKEYSRLRAALPAVEALDDDGRTFVVKNSEGYEEQWRRPQWVLLNMRKTGRVSRAREGRRDT